jgi:DNA/RNA-binding domain of Phe-tRNA-synthetase-like protein
MSLERLNEHPYIMAWRETYRRFGAKPKDHRPTAEALLRRVVRGEDLPTISTIVDLYLAGETEYYLPIGGYDRAHIVGDITLRFSPGNEPFVPIGASQATETTFAGEVVYSDAEKVLTRRWNYRDCDAAKITAASQNIVLLCEAAMPEIPTDHVQCCAETLAANLERFCGGTLNALVITRQTAFPLEL